MFCFCHNLCIFLNFQLLAKIFYIIKLIKRTHFMSPSKIIDFFQDVVTNFPKNVSYWYSRRPRSATFFYISKLFSTNYRYFLQTTAFFYNMATSFYKSQLFSAILQLFSTNRNYFLHSCNFLYNIETFFYRQPQK